MRSTGLRRLLPSPAMGVALAALVVAVAGVAVASIPGPNGVVKACYDSRGAVRVIDSSASCGPSESPLDLTAPGAFDALRPYVEFAPGKGGHVRIVAADGIEAVTRLSRGKFCVRPTTRFDKVTGSATAEFSHPRHPAMAFVKTRKSDCPQHSLEVITGRLVNGKFRLADERAAVDPTG